MTADRVPSISIAVIHNGESNERRDLALLNWTGAVTAETLFQSGSISKPSPRWPRFAWCKKQANARHDVNQALASWKFRRARAPAAVVTLRELLNHTAG